MKSLLFIAIAALLIAPAAFAGENKSGQAKDACCAEKAKATECSSAKGGCCAKEAALRQVLLTHKGAQLALR